MNEAENGPKPDILRKHRIKKAKIYQLAYIVSTALILVVSSIVFLWHKFDELHKADTETLKLMSTEKISRLKAESGLEGRIIVMETLIGLAGLSGGNRAGVPAGSDPRSEGSSQPSAILLKDPISIESAHWGIGNSWRDVTPVISDICNGKVFCAENVDVSKQLAEVDLHFDRELVIYFSCGEKHDVSISKGRRELLLSIHCF